MVNYIKQIRRAILGSSSAIGVDVIPQADDGITIAADGVVWGTQTTGTIVGTSNSDYRSGIAAVTVSNFSNVAANWEGELQIRTGTEDGTIVARIPIAGYATAATDVIPSTTITLPKMILIDPATDIYVSLSSVGSVADECNVKITLAIDV